MDIVRIADLPVRCHIGVPPHERALEQELRLNIDLSIDIRHAAAEDDFEQTVDYSAVAKRAEAVARAKPRSLIETLAEDLAAAIVDEFAVQAVRLEVRKPGALHARGAAFAAVEIHRSRRG